MKPEERARVKIDKQLNNAGWEIVSRNEYVPNLSLIHILQLCGWTGEKD